jgi:hypothetical protein
MRLRTFGLSALILCILIFSSNLLLVNSTDGLVAFWNFDEGSGVRAHDSSGMVNDGWLYGGVDWVKLSYGEYALSFDGSSGYVDIPHALYSEQIQELTVLAWIWCRNLHPYKEDIVYIGDNGEAELQYRYGPALEFKVKLPVGPDGPEPDWWEAYTEPETFPIERNRWYYVVGHWKKGNPGTVEIYVNGAKRGGRGDLPDLCLFDPGEGKHPTIGAYHDHDSIYDKFFNGVIDEVEVYTTLASYEPPPEPPPPLPPSGVGGFVVPVDKLALLAPYIGLTSTAILATVATVIYVKLVKRRKEKQ